MNPIHIIRENPEAFADLMKKRGVDFDLIRFKDLEARRKKSQIETESLQAKRNQLSKEVGRAKAQKEDASALIKELSENKSSVLEKQVETQAILDEMNAWMLTLPNVADDSVPDGDNEDANVLVRTWGDIPKIDQPKDHLELSSDGSGIDMEGGARLSGSRFPVLTGAVARLHRALSQFMLDLHVTEHGYREYNIPLMVSEECFYGTGQLPKFAEDSFQVNHHNHRLIPTAEVPLTNLFREQIVEENQLPIKMVAHSACFRSEAGSHGKDTRGMFRVHQFEKVELVQLVHPQKSEEALQSLLNNAETVLQRLELPYRVVILCTGDLGFSSAKTYDIEVWIPAQNKYREVSSCSRFNDFQARRMSARYRKSDKSTGYLHTLNGSGLAVGRTLIAFLENHQNGDGSIHIPEALRPYLGGASGMNL